MLLKVKHVDNDVCKLVRVDLYNNDEKGICTEFWDEVDKIAQYTVDTVHYTDSVGDVVQLNREWSMKNLELSYKDHFERMAAMQGTCKVIIQHRTVNIIPDYTPGEDKSNPDTSQPELVCSLEPITRSELPKELGVLKEIIFDVPPPPTPNTDHNPRIVENESGKFIYIDGKLNDHPDGTPAATYNNGRIEYYQKGVLHKEDGYAVIDPKDGNQHWFKGEKFTNEYRKNIKIFIDNIESLTEDDENRINNAKDSLSSYLEGLVIHNNVEGIKKLLKSSKSCMLSKDTLDNLLYFSVEKYTKPSLEIFKLLLMFENSDLVESKFFSKICDEIVNNGLEDHFKCLLDWTDRNGLCWNVTNSPRILVSIIGYTQKDMFNLVVKDLKNLYKKEEVIAFLHNYEIIFEAALKTGIPYYVKTLLDLGIDISRFSYYPLEVVLTLRQDSCYQDLAQLVKILLDAESLEDPTSVQKQVNCYLSSGYTNRLPEVVQILMDWRGPNEEYIDFSHMNVSKDKKDNVQLLLDWRGPNGECYDVFKDSQNLSTAYPNLLRDRLTFNVGNEKFRLKKRLKVDFELEDNVNSSNTVLLWCERVE